MNDFIKYRGREFFRGDYEDESGLFIDSENVDPFKIKDFDYEHFDECVKIMVDTWFESCERNKLPFPYFYMCGYSLFELDGDEYDGIDDDCSSHIEDDYWWILEQMVCGGWHELDAEETADFVRKVNTDYYDVRKEFSLGFKAYSYMYEGTERIVVIPWIKD